MLQKIKDWAIRTLEKLHWIVPYVNISLFVLTGVQAQMAVSPPFENEHYTTIASAVLLFLGVALTATRQLLSVQIDTKSLWVTLCVFLTALLGGINDIMNVVPLTNSQDQWIRFFISVGLWITGGTSKAFFSTPETKSKI